jgi:hypothetical protein
VYYNTENTDLWEINYQLFDDKGQFKGCSQVHVRAEDFFACQDILCEQYRGNSQIQIVSVRLVKV